MLSKHFLQSIILEKPPLPLFPAFDDHQETPLKIRVRVFPIKAINFAGLWDFLCYIEGVESKMGSPLLHWGCWEARCLSLRFEVVDHLSHPADSDLIDLRDVTFAVLHFSDAAQISYSFYDELVLICRNISKYGTRSPRGRVIPSPARMQNMTDCLRWGCYVTDVDNKKQRRITKARM